MLHLVTDIAPNIGRENQSYKIFYMLPSMPLKFSQNSSTVDIK